MEVNSTNTSVTASILDIDDTTGAVIGTIDSYAFAGSSFATVEMAGISHQNQGWGTVDNFTSSFLEPTTLMMLVLGGGVLLRRRRSGS